MEKQTGESKEIASQTAWESLGAIEVGRENLRTMVANESEEELADPYLDYEDYRYRGQLLAQYRMLVLKLKDNPETELLYPLEEPTYPRLSPSDTVALLKYSLDPRLIKRLIVLDDLNEDEYWFKQTTNFTYEPGQIAIEAKSSSRQALTLFRPTSLEKLHEPFDREWLTILQGQDHEAAGIFRQVDDLEELVLPNPNLSLELLEALWCTFGLLLLSPQAAVPLVVAEQNPIRCAVVAMSIKNRLLSLPPHLKSARHEQILSRCNYMGGRVSTDAERDLNNRLMNPSADKIGRISVILEYLQRTTSAS